MAWRDFEFRAIGIEGHKAYREFKLEYVKGAVLLTVKTRMSDPEEEWLYCGEVPPAILRLWAYHIECTRPLGQLFFPDLRLRSKTDISYL